MRRLELDKGRSRKARELPSTGSAFTGSGFVGGSLPILGDICKALVSVP